MRRQQAEMMPNAFLLASATFLISAVTVSAYRYVLLTNLMVGDLKKAVNVKSGLDCSDLANAQSSIGFQLKPTSDGKEFECSMFGEVRDFEPRKTHDSASKQHFLADPEGYAPWCPSESPPVRQILRFRECKYSEQLCEALRRLRNKCEAVGNENCERYTTEFESNEPIVNTWSTSTSTSVFPKKTTTTAESTSPQPEPKKPCSDGWHLDAEGMDCCSAGYKFSSVYQKCLAMITLKSGIKNQSEMNGECAYSGGKTISIANAKQNEEIKTRFVSLSGTTIIGFQIPEGKVWTKDGFRWVDGLVSNYTNWRFSTKEPNNHREQDERIAYMDVSGQWIDSTLEHAITAVTRITCSKDAVIPADVL